MLKRFFLSICSIALFASTQASALEVLTEVRASYFMPTDKTFRKIYGDGGGMYGIETSSPIWCSLHGFLGVDYFTKKGHSYPLHDSTRIKLIPVTFGLKYFYSLDCLDCSCINACGIDLYGAAGAQYTYFQTKDDSPYVINPVTKRGWGGIAKVGSLIHFDGGLFLDIFGQYSFLTMKFSDTRHDTLIRHDAHLNGWSVGLGLGYRFGCN